MTQMTCLDGTRPSRFIFGTMQFGGKADAAQSQALFETCRAAGITHFDTARVYTGGVSEELLGQFAQEGREGLFIASKFGHGDGASAANMRAQFDATRRALGMDVVDLYYLHMFDPDTDLHETMESFAALKSKGQIRYVGLSNFAAWQVMKAVAVARAFDLSIDAFQPMYNLVKRQAEVEILPMCADQGISVAAYSPLGGGLLTGKYSAGGEGRLSEDTRYATRYGQDWMQDTARGLADLAAEIGTDAATLAVAWVAHHETAPMPIISGRTAEQLTPSLAAMTFDMDAALYARLSALSPTPPPPTDRIEEQG